jgi:Ca2+-binding EF-hand superfamily protein
LSKNSLTFRVARNPRGFFGLERIFVLADVSK